MSYQFDFGAIAPYLPLLAQGVATTLAVSVAGGFGGFVLSIAGAWMHAEGRPWARMATRAYVEIFRNTPFLIQLFFIFFGLPQLHVKLDAIEASLLAVTVNFGAYGTEILRSAMAATPRGQHEAGASLAMTRFQIFRYVLLRPALQKVWPALTSQFIIMMLTTSVCSQITLNDISHAADFIQGRTFRAFETYASATLTYLLLAIVLRHALHAIGKRFVIARITPRSPGQPARRIAARATHPAR
ncbi:amino acid ABC transporter permease [Paraburkholderia acidisoli]|uniref:ABC transporter permease subunit n=1 Tax=Paraburkholderia acidisoli TaxID=2571748 RepID=A0A7Z2GPL0_9BURK|nr:amino acid ABC transporter permease [Paraburkholderia acidisoli]QGZ65626.1 ABC transporter permease subunit [Paraburkholderia acidisoli]